MSAAPGIILVAGGVTLANEALNVPYSQGNTDVLKGINWRVVPATAIAALIFSGISKLNEPIANALAGLVLATTLLIRTGNAPAPAEHLAQILGY
jgi:hypothetical protein